MNFEAIRFVTWWKAQKKVHNRTWKKKSTFVYKESPHMRKTHNTTSQNNSSIKGAWYCVLFSCVDFFLSSVDFFISDVLLFQDILTKPFSWAIGHIAYKKTRSHSNSAVKPRRGTPLLSSAMARERETANRYIYCFIVCPCTTRSGACGLMWLNTGKLWYCTFAERDFIFTKAISAYIFV